jgi:hypothetical protein
MPIPLQTQEVTSLRDLGYMVRAEYMYPNHGSSPVAIALKSAFWWLCSKSRSSLDWVIGSFFWRSDRECGTHPRVNLLSPGSRARRSPTVDTPISKWLAIFFAEANGFLERNFDTTSPKIVSDLLALFLSSQDVLPSLNRRNYHFTVGRDTARSPRVHRKWVWIALLTCSCSQRDLMTQRCSRSSINIS